MSNVWFETRTPPGYVRGYVASGNTCSAQYARVWAYSWSFYGYCGNKPRVSIWAIRTNR
jgi:hypothetical protein